MLLRVILKNFLSFKDEVQFDMFPNTKLTSLNWHIIDKYKVPILKQAAVYGPNGAGKSNLIKGFRFIKEMVLNKDYLTNQSYDSYKFALMASNNCPIEIAIEFISTDKKAFIYNIKISKDGIDEEALYISSLGKGKNSPVFKRKKSNIQFSSQIDDVLMELSKRMLKRYKYSSFLALNEDLPLVINSDISSALKWFKDSFIIIDANTIMPTLIDILRRKDKIYNFSQSMLRNLCLGIEGIDIETENADEWVSKHTEDLPLLNLESLKEGDIISRIKDERQSISVFTEKGIKKVSRLIFNQLGPEGYIGQMDIEAESDGTVRLLTLLPAMYEAIYQDKTIIVDEIDYKLHPTLIKGLIKFFADQKNTTGQIVFTTHETAFMEKIGIFRNDEIWFVDKKEGSSRLYSLNDFKLHHTMSVRNGYLDGRFGGTPNLNDLVSIFENES